MLFGNSGANLLTGFGTVMSNNTAMTGGAVHCDSCQQLTMTTGSIIEHNHAARGGGACCLTCECILFQDVHFLNNRWAYSTSAVAATRGVCISTTCAPAVSHYGYVHPLKACLLGFQKCWAPAVADVCLQLVFVDSKICCRRSASHYCDCTIHTTLP